MIVDFARQLRLFRLSLGLTQAEAAKALDKSLRQYADIERGLAPIPAQAVGLIAKNAPAILEKAPRQRRRRRPDPHILAEAV
ncbi:helix-turn-helix domain-containing protein [Niveispirillum sp. SYP-B3756]|uniref:helix-turn-helix transcriptional regulator n=1 Tax=Niveispirillum sp. SYP-B3756 TaxID=2662178 RepID=UPI00129244CC|nr:helix-turn-helix transcriptional regulator [Niveispirillum sp. SYP-B3756]MQP68660.1 helix-turn-helix domain-containing protein [Niveispirillum sp. SYP-B3756]